MIESKITGIPDLKAALAGIVPKLRYRALRNALAAGARVVQRAARAATPVLSSASSMVRRGYRKPGTLRRAISVRTSRLARRGGDVGVFVNVRPAKKGARGAKNPNDPFYWRWINWGWRPAAGRVKRGGGVFGLKVRRAATNARALPGVRFLEAGAAQLGAALQAFIKTIGPQIQKLNRPKAPPP